MTILFVTGHPAQIHNFRVAKKLLEQKGHKVVWVASAKEISFQLLELYGIPATEIARPTKGMWNKIKTLLGNAFIIYKLMKKEKVDMVVSRVSPFAALAAFWLRKPHIALADTEVSGFYDTLFSRMVDVLITSKTFKRDLRKDQIKIPANIELFYLHPNHYQAKEDVFNYLGLQKGDSFVVLRFVSWGAYHDVGMHGYDEAQKIKAVQSFEKFGKVFISAEGELPEILKPYQIKIPFDLIHDALYHAKLFLGEGASMAAEAAILGTPAIFLNDIWSGNGEDMQKFGIFYGFKSHLNDQENSIAKGLELLQKDDLKEWMKSNTDQYMSDKIDASSFLVWFIENFPKSKNEVLTVPTALDKFKSNHVESN
jgi:uncharacterized protein